MCEKFSKILLLLFGRKKKKQWEEVFILGWTILLRPLQALIKWGLHELTL